MKKHFSIAMMGLLVVSNSMFVGCGGGKESTPPVASSSPEATEPAATPPATNAAPADATSSMTVVAEGEKTEPAQSAAIFLDSLRSGDEAAANGQLTARAREELQKTSFQMRPLGTPEGKFKIGRVVFPYAEKTASLVECIWTEPAVGQEPGVNMEIVCEVHKEGKDWRIAAMTVSTPGTDDALTLDFENAGALQAALDGAIGGEPATAQDTSSTGIPAQTVSGANQLPAATAPPTGAGSMPQHQVPPAGSAAPPANYPSLPQLPPAQPQGTAAPVNNGSALPPLPPIGGNN